MTNGYADMVSCLGYIVMGGSNVDGEIMRQLSNLLEIEKSKSSRLHPDGDGISEATVKQIKAIIRKHVDYYGHD